MSLGLRADPTNTSAVISVAGTDQVVITNASNVVATTFTGALTGNASTATALSTASGAAPSYGVRAWVNFDGTRDTSGAVSTANTPRLIRAQGNVSSVLRNQAGDYTINLATAMPDANYALSGICQEGTGSSTPDRILLDENVPHTASLATILVIAHNSSVLVDSAVVMVMFIR